MTRKHSITAVITALSVLCLASLGTAFAASSSNSSSSKDNMTKQAGDYTIALKLLPAEQFVNKSEAKKKSNKGDMVNGGGAEPNQKGGSQNPNHHLVAFIKKNGNPVEDADVSISYKKENGSSGKMKKLPVNRMWVAGVGEKTTHYGNNVKLESGKYQVRVTVNNKASANFDLNVS